MFRRILCNAVSALGYVFGAKLFKLNISKFRNIREILLQKPNDHWAIWEGLIFLKSDISTSLYFLHNSLHSRFIIVIHVKLQKYNNFTLQCAVAHNIGI